VTESVKWTQAIEMAVVDIGDDFGHASFIAILKRETVLTRIEFLP